MALNYEANPQETPAEVFLSGPTMAERYAMYNVFLGFQLATQLADQGDYNCAAAVLGATRSNAATWNELHGTDPDITADLQLADMFLANLRSQGATGDVSVGACPAAGNPYPGYGDDVYYDQAYACSSSKGGAGLLFVLGALLVARRRRR